MPLTKGCESYEVVFYALALAQSNPMHMQVIYIQEKSSTHMLY